MAQRVFTQTFGVVGAILEQDGKILLVQEFSKPRSDRGATDTFADKGKWNQPAGWIDVGEDPLIAAEREVLEEAGIKVHFDGLLGIYSLHRTSLASVLSATPHAIKLIFRARLAGAEPKVNKTEISDARWFTPEEIYNMDINILRDFDIKQEVQDYFAGRIYPLDIIRHS